MICLGQAVQALQALQIPDAKLCIWEIDCYVPWLRVSSRPGRLCHAHMLHGRHASCVASCGRVRHPAHDISLLLALQPRCLFRVVWERATDRVGQASQKFYHTSEILLELSHAPGFFKPSPTCPASSFGHLINMCLPYHFPNMPSARGVSSRDRHCQSLTVPVCPSGHSSVKVYIARDGLWGASGLGIPPSQELLILLQRQRRRLLP